MALYEPKTSAITKVSAETVPEFPANLAYRVADAKLDAKSRVEIARAALFQGATP